VSIDQSDDNQTMRPVMRKGDPAVSTNDANITVKRAARRKAVTAGVLFGVVAGMVGLSFASVPLYRMFCQATGYDGTPRTENVARSDRVTDRKITIRFDANVNPSLPWQFHPVQRQVTVKVGEEALILYEARNVSDKPLTGTATFSVVPEKAAQYFSKIQCFCFTEQTLAAGQDVQMPVLFYIDPAIDDDPETQDVTQFTLSYTFFPDENGAAAGPVVGKVDGVAATTNGAGG
jgi:Cytochrome oxidase assembly factor